MQGCESQGKQEKEFMKKQWRKGIGLLLALGLTGCGDGSVNTGENRSEHSHGNIKHSHKLGENSMHAGKTVGPNGGRLITSVEPNFEFLVQEDRKVRLTFVDGNARPIDVASMSILLKCGDRMSPTELAFAQAGDVLISDKSLPEGNILPVVLTIQTTPDGDPVYEKFNVDFSTCAQCRFGEYACICGH